MAAALVVVEAPHLYWVESQWLLMVAAAVGQVAAAALYSTSAPGQGVAGVGRVAAALLC